MPQLGPAYDLAKRLAALEDQVRRLVANQIGQAFSATQSDGSVGVAVQQDPTTGATALIFYQGTTTGRDSQTGQHPWLLYLGELVSGGKFVDSGMILYRPNGTEIMTAGSGGFQLFDAAGGLIFAPDENSGHGLARPYLPLPLPVSSGAGNWPSTTATSWATIAISNVYLQHPRIRWQGSAYAPSGTDGQVQLYLPGNVALGSAVSVTGGSFATIDETITVPGYAFLESTQIVVQAQVTAGTGAVSCQTTGLYGIQS